MHVQIVNFELRGLDEAAYAETCEQLAPVFAEMPGLLSKVWLADSDTSTYGGVYLWADQGGVRDVHAQRTFRRDQFEPSVCGCHVSRLLGVGGADLDYE